VPAVQRGQGTGWKGKMLQMSLPVPNRTPVRRHSPASATDLRKTSGPPVSTSYCEFDPHPYRLSLVVLRRFDRHELCVDLPHLSDLIAVRVMFP